MRMIVFHRLLFLKRHHQVLTTYRQNRPSMSDTSKQPNRNTCRNVRRGKIRRLAHSRSPHDHTPNHTHNKLSTGNEPMGVDHVGGLFVVDIVKSIASVPCRDQANLGRGDRRYIELVQIKLYEIKMGKRSGQQISPIINATRCKSCHL